MDNVILVHVIPEFNKQGYLPPGSPYKANWAEFEARFGTNDHRRRLLVGLKEALENLKEAGCRQVYVDGSFITDKSLPADWDACWDIEGVNSRLLDPVIIDADFNPDRLKAKYSGDLFLQAPRLPGGNFVRFFQTDRYENKKGIVLI